MSATPAFPFPKDFVWGCATASYQVEGAARTDGRGPSIWDTFSHTPGKTFEGHTGDVACDQYHRYRDDVALMKSLGIKGYRFSISWSRVLPTGRGQVNEAGMAYYERLVDELLANGITPYATLFHWDLPQALQDDFGGWESRDTAQAFGDYAALIGQRLTDRVKQIFTINEFMCFTDIGYSHGKFAPGKTLPPAQRNQIRHHGVLGHGLALQALRAHARPGTRLGLAENASVCVPVIESPEHVAAAREAMRVVNAPWLTACLEGAYHEAYLRAEGANAPRFSADDMAIIGGAIDFLGMNMYAPLYIRAAPESADGWAVVPPPSSYPKLNMDWLLMGPPITYWGPRWASEIWGVKDIVISENGCSSTDTVAADGEVYDTDRLMYVREHLIHAQRAVREGYPLKGYFWWSLMDNFEWAEGYSKRFGFTYVDYQTLKRTLKLSGKFYRETIARGGVQ